MRGRYWNCTKFADWLRGTPKPYAADSRGWREWEAEAKKKSKIRYWIAEEGLDYIQNILMYPIDKIYGVKYWLVNRFVTKTHALTGTLEKGQWHEMDERIINCLFTELVDFVEIEVAHKNIMFSEEAEREYKAPFYSKGWWRFRVWRCPEAGLSHLDWESQLIMDESYGLNKNDPEYGQPTEQSLKAQEISELYFWWKYSRPKRKDPYDISGWTAYCENKRKNGGDIFDLFDEEESEEEKKEVRRMLDLQNKIEEDYYQEDENMLIRLMKIRRNLWT